MRCKGSRDRRSFRELLKLGIVNIIQTDVNPVGGTATIHVDAAMPTCLVQEICSGGVAGEKENLGGAVWFSSDADGKRKVSFAAQARAGL